MGSSPPPASSPPPYRVSLSLLVVPEAEAMVPKTKHNRVRFVYLKFTTSRSSGVKTRHLLKAPLVNDLHVANLHTDKVRAEAALTMKNKEYADLLREYQRVCSELARGTKAVSEATLMQKEFPQTLKQQATVKEQAKRIKRLQAECRLAVSREQEALLARAKAITERKGFKDAATSATRDLRDQTTRLAAAMRKADAWEERHSKASETMNQMSEKARDLLSALNATAENVSSLHEAAAGSEAAVLQLEQEVARVSEELATAEEVVSQNDDRFIEATLAQPKSAATGPKRGRPTGHRGADWLTEQWDSYRPDARRQAFHRHCVEIKDALDSGGISNWLPSALSVVLDSLPAADGSWVDQLFSTRPFCKRKNSLILDLRDVIQAEWGVDLAQYALVDVGLSHRMYQSLRNAWNKSLFTPINSSVDDPRCGMYTPRPWQGSTIHGEMARITYYTYYYYYYV